MNINLLLNFSPLNPLTKTETKKRKKAEESAINALVQLSTDPVIKQPLEKKLYSHYLSKKISSEYSFENVEIKLELTLKKFTLIHPSLKSLKIDEKLKSHAVSLMHFVQTYFKNQILFLTSQLKPKLSKEISQDQVNAKLYSLALRTLIEVSLYSAPPFSWKTVDLSLKKNPLSSHLKLLGKYGKILSIKIGSKSIHLIKIKKIVGAGTYNQVYHVYDLEQCQSFILRKLKIDKTTTEEDLQADLNNCNLEMKVHQELLNLNIPGIVKLHDVYQIKPPQKQRFAALLEKCEGDLLDLAKNLSISNRYLVTQQILYSLIHLHQHEFIHRDLKPSNIFYTYENNKIHTKIGDFGFVCKIGDDNEIVGTYFYQPWDAFLIIPQISSSSDCWAIGLIAYQLKYCPNLKSDEHGPYISAAYDRLVTEMGFLEKELEKVNFKNFADFEPLIRKKYHSFLKSSYFINNMNNSKEVNLYELHDKIIEFHFYPQCEEIFNLLISQLDQTPYDQMIAGLLNPNLDARILLKNALKLITL